MDNKKTVLTIFGTRPEVIKLFPVLKILKQDKDLNSIAVSTSQHREMIDDLLKLFTIVPDYDLNIIRENQSLVDISTCALSGLDPILKRHRPNLVIVQGDTTTAFIGTLAAFYHKIPVGHVEAGLRSFDKMHPYPEEINRKLISVISDLYFAPTIQNAKNLLDEKIDPRKIFITGNTVIDSLLYVANKNCGALGTYLRRETLESTRMILVTAHRRENWGSPLENLCYALIDLVKSFSDVEIVFPVHLNPNVRGIVFPLLSDQERIHLLDPLPYEAFVEAMDRAYFIITDSGGIQEEGPSFRKPILVFRQVTERPEGVEGGGVKLIGLTREQVFQEVAQLLRDESAYRSMVMDHNPYGDGHAAQRIIQGIHHYFNLADRPKDFIGEKIPLPLGITN